MKDHHNPFHGMDDRRTLIDQTPHRRRVVNIWPKIGAILSAIGGTILVYGIHRGDDFIMVGAILQSVGTAIGLGRSRQDNRSSQDNRIR